MRAETKWPPLWGPVLSGVTLCLSFPSFGLFPLAWIALLPYLDFLLQRPSWKRVLAGHFLLTLLFFGGTLYWIPSVITRYGGLNQLVALPLFLLMLLTMGLLVLPFSCLVAGLARFSAKAAVAALPGAWTLCEWSRNYVGFGGFPWASLGYSQMPFSWFIQSADWGGVWVLSFALAGANSLIWWAWRRGSRQALVFLAGGLILLNLYGAYRIHFWEPPPGEALQVALVQPGIGLAEDLEHYAQKYFEALPAYYSQAAREKAQWIIFPEAQNPYLFGTDFYFTSFWQRQVRQWGIPLLFNSARLDPNHPGRYYNGALLLGAGGEVLYEYRKTHLVPFGEYVPGRRWLPFLDPLVKEVSEFSPGSGPVVGRLGTLPFGTLICYEAIFPELSRSYARAGAQVLVNLTNDTWYGPSAAPYQHFQMARMRSLETRKPLLRCANSGISAVVDAKGRILRRLDLEEEGMLSVRVAGNAYQSIFVRWGDGVILSFIIGNGVLVLLWVRRDREKGREGSKKSRGSL